MSTKKVWKLRKLFGNWKLFGNFWKLVFAFVVEKRRVSMEFPSVSTPQSFQFSPLRGNWETFGNQFLDRSIESLLTRKHELYKQIENGDHSDRALNEFIKVSRKAAIALNAIRQGKNFLGCAGNGE